MELTADALLFDLDGTLVDSSASIERAWAGWAATHGVDLEVLLRVMPGRPGHETMAMVVPDLPADQLVAENLVLLELQTADTVDVVALPGARELLSALPAGRWCLVTACDRDLAEARLRAAGLPVPALMVTPDDVARGKPDPEGHLVAASALGIPPVRCVVLEDAPSGLEAARSAGMRSVAVTTTHAAAELGDADLIVAGLDALEVLGRGPFTLRAR